MHVDSNYVQILHKVYPISVFSSYPIHRAYTICIDNDVNPTLPIILWLLVHKKGLKDTRDIAVHLYNFWNLRLINVRTQISYILKLKDCFFVFLFVRN